MCRAGVGCLVLRDLFHPQQFQDSVIPPPPFLPLLGRAEAPGHGDFLCSFCFCSMVQILGKTGKLRCQCGSGVASKTAQGKADFEAR